MSNTLPPSPPPPPPTSSRRLAAIMFTDIVGYSALTQRDEALALDLLSEHNQLIRGVLAAHQGREIKTVGDAFLVEFDSALEAVRCAMRIQRDLSQRNAGHEVEPINVRVGIHLGDVVYREGDVFGDGVNIAARVQASADAGEIRVSEDVARQVANKIEPKLIDLGVVALKNILQSVRIYAVEGFGSPSVSWPALPTQPMHSTDTRASSAASALANAAKPSVSIDPRAPRRGMLFTAAALVALLVVTAAMLWHFNSQKQSQAAAIGSVAVLPFENASGDAAIDYLSDGISESLINKLAGLAGVSVISRTSAFAFKGKKIDPMEIGRKLGVDALILGTVVQRGTNLTITTELVRVSNAAQLWGEKYNRQADDILKIESEITATIAQTLRLRFSSDDTAKLARTATTDPEAYRLYLQGRVFGIGSQRDMDKSVDLLKQAVARAPDYALAHAGLAEAYTRQAFLRASSRAEVLDLARVSANRALALDPNLAEAHTALGLVRFYFEWDWPGADTMFRKALALNPGSSAVHQSYGIYLTAMGRLEEGLTHSREAARLDPLSVASSHDLGVNAWARGNLNETVAIFRRAVDSDPNWTWGYTKLSRALAMQKKCPEAIVQAQAAERLIGDGAAALVRAWLGVTYARCGDTRRAQQKLSELHAQEKQRYVDPVTFALIHAALGETNEALRLFEKAYEDRTPNMVYLSLDAAFDPEFAKQPRYQAILEHMKFPKK